MQFGYGKASVLGLPGHNDQLDLGVEIACRRLIQDLVGIVGFLVGPVQLDLVPGRSSPLASRPSRPGQFSVCLVGESGVGERGSHLELDVAEWTMSITSEGARPGSCREAVFPSPAIRLRRCHRASA